MNVGGELADPYRSRGYRYIDVALRSCRRLRSEVVGADHADILVAGSLDDATLHTRVIATEYAYSAEHIQPKR